MTHSIATLCIECHFAEHHYAECRISFIVILNVVMLSVVMVNVVAPPKCACTKLLKFPISQKFRKWQNNINHF